MSRESVEEAPPPVPTLPNYDLCGESNETFSLPPQMHPIDTKLTLDLFHSNNQEFYRRRCTAVDECVSACECCRSPLPDPSLIPYIDEPNSEPLIFESEAQDRVVTPKVRRIFPSLSFDKSEDSKPETADAMCQTPTSNLDDVCVKEYETPKESPPSYNKNNLKLEINNELPEMSDIQCRLKRTLFSMSKSISSRSEDTDIPTYSTDSCGTSNSEHVNVNDIIETPKAGAKQILDSVDRKSWKSPDEFRPTVGTVKALTKHFNNINLRYCVKSYKRNCQSSPNLSTRDDKCMKIKENLHNSASLADILYESNKTESPDTTKHMKLSEEEVKSFVIQLEDWSKFGSRGSEDTLAQGNEFELPNLPSEETSDTLNNAIVFNEIVDKKPKVITLDNIKIKSSQSSCNSDQNKTVREQGRRGSLEKLSGNKLPRVVAVIPRRQASSLLDISDVRLMRSSTDSDESGMCRLREVIRQSCPHLVSSKAPTQA